MLFDPETAGDLKPWLIRTLEPICDAEPNALADYILALLKHNAPEAELRKELSSQLDEFLEKEGPSFLDTLFTALRTKSYLPYSATSPSTGYPSSSTQEADVGIPIPLDALLSPSIPTSPERRRKRSLDHDDREFRPAKGPRLSNDGQFSRYGQNDNRPSWGGRGDRGGRISGRGDYMDGAMPNGGMGMGMSQNGRIPSYQPPDRAARGICRDYHNNGYCARGAFCKYNHGDDAVVPAQFFPMNGAMGPMPFVPMMGSGGTVPFGMGGASNAAYDPHERMDMRPVQGSAPMGNRPINPRTPTMPRQSDPSGAVAQKPGELPVVQDLTPQASREDGSSHGPGPSGGYNGVEGSGPSNGDVVMNGMSMPAQPQDVDRMSPMSMPHPNGRRPFRGPRQGGGHFGGEISTFRPEKRNDKTLVVEKIPEDKLSLGSVNEWFKRFGTVTNVAVDVASAKALVSFSSHDEALAAWRSEDAVFGNRFVKVFWHRPMAGHGEAGARALAASAPLVANIGAKEATPAPATPAESSTSQPVRPTSTPSRKTSTPSATAALAARQQLLEQQIAEQKSLMTQLATASPQEKKDIMARLRKLGEEMKPAASSSRPPPPAASQPLAKTPRGITPRPDDKERLERERLDKELELHHAVSAAEGEAEENTEELKAVLDKLKAEAASLGIDAPDASYGGSSYRPYRGRGRGRGRVPFRGAMRGGPPRGSMKLDLRPKKLLIKGVSTDAVQAVREWYETTGQVESVDPTDTGDIVVSFRSRAAAEQGLVKGSSIPTIGQVQISWQNTQAAPPLTKTSPPTEEILSVAKTAVEEPHSSLPSHEDDTHLPEEFSASSWGGDDAENDYGIL